MHIPNKKRIAFALVFGLMISNWVFAFQLPKADTIRIDSLSIKTQVLDEVVVTSSRTTSSIHTISAPIQMVGQSTIANNEMGDLPSVLSNASGIQMQSGTFQTNRIVIRGIGSRSPYSTNRTRAYFNDIPLTTGDGTTVVDDVELSFINRVEITKGPYSAWYGGGMGGAIRFVSDAEADKKISVESSAIAGSYGFQKYTGIVKTQYKHGSIHIGMAHHNGDGYRQNSQFSRNSLLISGKNGENIKFNYLFLINDVKSNTPSSIDYATFQDDPSKAAANWLKVEGFKDYKRILGGVKSEIPLGQHISNTTLISGSLFDQYELRPFNILDDNSTSVSIQDYIQFKYRRYTTSLGMELMQENYTWEILANNSLTQKLNTSEKRKQWNAFFNFETKPISSFIFSLNGNLNSTKYDIVDLFPTDSIDYSGSYYNDLIFSPKIGVTYKYNSFFNLYASAGHGFSNPTVEESLSSEGFFNTNLKPEQGWTVEVGSRVMAYQNKFWMDFSVYSIFLNDLLVTKRLSEEVFYGENAGQSNLFGAEIQLTYKPNPFIQTNFSSSKSLNQFNEFVSDDIDYSGNHLPGIPNFNANIDIQANYRQLQFNSTLTYSGSQYMDDANSVTASDWTTVNLRLSYTLTVLNRCQINFVSSVRNLFNEHYASMVLVNAPSFSGRAPRYYYPGMPTNYLFAIEFKFQ